MSLPYHIGNGWFGGMLPLTATAMVAATGNIYYGLWYPIVVAVMTLVIGSIFLRETQRRDIRTYQHAVRAHVNHLASAARTKARRQAGFFISRALEFPLPRRDGRAA